MQGPGVGGSSFSPQGALGPSPGDSTKADPPGVLPTDGGEVRVLACDGETPACPGCQEGLSVGEATGAEGRVCAMALERTGGIWRVSGGQLAEN